MASAPASKNKITTTTRLYENKAGFDTRAQTRIPPHGSCWHGPPLQTTPRGQRCPVCVCVCAAVVIGSRAHDETQQSTAIARSPKRCLCASVACMMQSKLSCLCLSSLSLCLIVCMWLEPQQEHSRARTTADSPTASWVPRGDQSHHHHHIAQSWRERRSTPLQRSEACY